MPLVNLSDIAAAVQPSATNRRTPVAGNTPSAPRDPNTYSSELMRGPYGGALSDGDRFPTILTSDLWIREGKYLQLHAGPASANWSVGIRAGDEETQGGSARFASPRAGHHGQKVWMGHPHVNYQFQSGNILPVIGGGGVLLPAGLGDFYHFLALLNQPPLLPEGENEGAHNYVWIFHTSLMFPDLLLKGYFEPGGTSWPEEAEGFAEVKWDGSFIVHDASPDIFNPKEMALTYVETMARAVRQF